MNRGCSDLTEADRRMFGEVLDLLAHKLVADESRIGVEFPYVTAPDGSWETMPASRSAGYSGDSWDHGNWFCGFWVGLLLAAYARTGSEILRSRAVERMQLVAQRAIDANTHDIGFIFCSSAIPAFRILRDSRYADLAVQAATRLRARLVTTPRGAYISSWGPLTDPRGRRSSAIDTMANLPLLYWAADYTDDGSYRLAGGAHAGMTREAFVRADSSTYHAVEYDTRTGRRARGYTFQGYSDESCWSRGQAWAIYGYAATAGSTGNTDDLLMAERLAEYYLGRLDGSLVPYWDFDDPRIPSAPRDSAAAAIVASALLEMDALHPEPSRAAHWRRHALAMLRVLCRDYLAQDAQHRGLLMHGCYSLPHRKGIDSAVLFGDYFFVEALCQLLLPGVLKEPSTRLDVSADHPSKGLTQ